MGKKMRTTIVERFTPMVESIITEKTQLPQGVLCRVVYPICKIGEMNRNKRVYDLSVWENVGKDADIVEKLKSRSLFGHAEHPQGTSQSSTEKISHVVNKIWVTEDNKEAKCEIDVLDTPYGRICDTLLRAGCGLGTSTRAEGELEEVTEEGKDMFYKVIPEAYSLKTIDFTADPSTYGAYPENVERDLVGIVKTGVDNEKIDRQYASVMLESMKAPEAKALLESMKKVDEMDPGAGGGPAGMPAASDAIPAADKDKKKKEEELRRGKISCEGYTNEDIAEFIDLAKNNPARFARLFSPDKKTPLTQEESVVAVGCLEEEMLGRDTNESSKDEIRLKMNALGARITQISDTGVGMDKLAGLQAKYEALQKKLTAAEKVNEKKAINEITVEDLEEIDVIKSLHQDNKGKEYTDEQWVRIIDVFLENAGKPFEELKQTNDELLGLLMSLDDATAEAIGESIKKAAQKKISEAANPFKFYDETPEEKELGKKATAMVKAEVAKGTEYEKIVKMLDKFKGIGATDTQSKEEVFKYIKKTRKLTDKEKEYESVDRKKLKENFDSLYAEMQKATDDVLDDKEKKTISEAKTVTALIQSMRRAVLEAKKALASMTAERDKAIEIGEAQAAEFEAKQKQANEKATAEKKALGEALLKELKGIYEKKMEGMKKQFEVSTKEMEEKHKKDIFLKTVVEAKIKESGLDLPEDAVTLLKKCKTSEEVDSLINKMRFAVRESIVRRRGEINIDGDGTIQADPSLVATENMLKSLR